MVLKPGTTAQLEGPRADGSPHSEGDWACSLCSVEWGPTPCALLSHPDLTPAPLNHTRRDSLDGGCPSLDITSDVSPGARSISPAGVAQG